MLKTVFVAFLSFILVSSLLLFIGYVFDITVFQFTFYEETEAGFVAGGSVIPFMLAIFVSYFVGNAYQRKRHSH
ncbi:hypothetical protein SAMN04487936_111120 [Halobacillus dabanensis]|uniref:Uncharacterized protein n=1 Tax=Halobacillus dabanensis TaxID=240302 RepID=A0A1I3YQB6_HALDA|nr:hypothetical protein [Halobacillus dabanensis]SFK33985.1 hypothetical protein SAMN04487936_111120 [Halobacillus dabanensis]